MAFKNHQISGLEIFLLVLLFLSGSGSCFADNSASADSSCGKGRTLQCLTLGMEAEKNKDNEAALTYYKMACKSHPTTNLRACTPMLALAGRMGVLDREAGFLEERCEKEGDTVCYYLGKEYLKVRKTERAIEHLEPLCRAGFKPADTRDFGPCFHLARSFHVRKDYVNARKFYQLDCGEDPEKVHPSCESLRNINLIFSLTPERAQEKVVMPKLGESLFILICVLPGLGVLVWFFGQPGGLWFLKWGGPVCFSGAFVVWLFFVERQPIQDIDIILLGFCFSTMAGLAFFSIKKESL